MKINGSCHCGFITIEGEADPERVAICHCTDCQTRTGSAFGVIVPVPGNTFKMRGQPTTYLKTTAESGNLRLQTFVRSAAHRSIRPRRAKASRRLTQCGSEFWPSATSSCPSGRTGFARRAPGSRAWTASTRARRVRTHNLSFPKIISGRNDGATRTGSG
jgi:hypothetical protein